MTGAAVYNHCRTFHNRQGFRQHGANRMSCTCFKPIRNEGKLFSCGAIVATLVAAAATHSVAQPIAITNAGFESNSVASNCFQGFIPTGWSLYDPSGIHDGAVDAVGGLNTEPGGPHFNDGAPEGDHVALVFIDGDIGGGPMGLSQTLAAVLEANTTYELSAQVGNIASGQGPPPCDVFGFFDLDGFPGYQVQLLAGGVVITEDDNSLAGTLPDGEFALSTTTIAIGNTHPQLGAALQIRLINLNMIDTPEDPGIEVDFDDIRLERLCAGAGDLDDSGIVDLNDLPIFVDVLIGLDETAGHVVRSDVNCSGTVDGQDIVAFVGVLLD